MRLQQPEAVFFDWDGTLVDTFPLLFNAYNHTRHTLGYKPWTEQEARKNIRLSGRDAFPAIFGEQAGKAADIYYEYVRSHHLDDLKTQKGAKKLLESIAGRNIPMGVISNKKHDILLSEIESLGWQDFFASVVGAGKADKDKPDPAPVLLALEEIKQKAGEHIWYIGDTSEDMHCAKKSGIKAIFVANGFGTHSELESLQNILKIENLFDLCEVMDVFDRNIE